MGIGMKTPMIKPSRKGLLHKKLGVPQGEKIPASKLAAAKKSDSPSERKGANFAIKRRQREPISDHEKVRTSRG